MSVTTHYIILRRKMQWEREKVSASLHRRKSGHRHVCQCPRLFAV